MKKGFRQKGSNENYNSDQQIDHKADWEQELEAHVGQIYLPDGKWKDPVLKTPLAFIDDDVWSDRLNDLVKPTYEQGIARFLDSVANANLEDVLLTSDALRFVFVLDNLDVEHARGDLFNENNGFIDREEIHNNNEEEEFLCDAFGKAPSHVLKRLRTKAHYPRRTALAGYRDAKHLSPEKRSNSIKQMRCYSIARKVFLARIGFPEYLKQSD